MRNCLLTILIIVIGQNIVQADVSATIYDAVKIAVLTADDNSEEKKYQNHHEGQQNNLHAFATSPLLFIKPTLVHGAFLSTHRESEFVDHPFTPPDLM